MLKIYGAPHSRAFRVIWLANEIGIPYEHIPVTFDPPNPQCKEPWYVALNPNGRVPSIDDEGFVMWESAAINLYLAEKYQNSLYSSTPQGRGRVLQWTFFVANDIEPAMITLFRNRVYFPRSSGTRPWPIRPNKHCAPSSPFLNCNLSRARSSVVTSGTWPTL